MFRCIWLRLSTRLPGCNRKLVQELGREPTLEEIAAELNLPIEKIIEANRTAADTLSLDMPVGDEEDTTIGSFVEDDNTPGPVDATSNAMLSEALTEILGTLTEREADVRVCASVCTTAARTRLRRSVRSSVLRVSASVRSKTRPSASFATVPRKKDKDFYC